ncbi:MAG: hypothetical protein KJ667_00160, partial [Alphaproteobacteria bacterium]|nr:hypothetical protein [Alphaproteobacteria bacterium]
MMIKFFKRRLSVPCALLLALLVIAPAYAQPEDYTENESLGFGQFGIIDNSVQYSLTVDFNSNVSHDPEFVLLAQPSRAEFFLNDLTPSVPFNVTLTPGTLSLNGLGQPPVFTVTN